MARKLLPLILLFAILLPLSGEIVTRSEKEGSDWIITLENRSAEAYEAMVVSSNSDYRPETGQIAIAPGATAALRILYNGTSSDQGEEKPLYLRLISDHSDNPGIITPGRERSGENRESGDREALRYFYTPDCSRCRLFLEKEIPRLEAELGRPIVLEKWDVTSPEGLKKMMETLGEIGSDEKKLPMITGKGIVLAGDEAIEEGLEGLILLDPSGSGQSGASSVAERNGSPAALDLLPVFLAGLLDGINPCAFTTLLFLISWLGVAGRSRKEILITGILFTLSVFVTYYAVGLGAFAAVRGGGSVRWIGIFMKYAMASALVILSGLHFRDYGKIRSGRISEITLQLSRERKRKIHSLIREKTRKAGLFAGSLILGGAVTIYELGCTGQVYLPTLMYMTRIEGKTSAFFLLGLYNLAFILPLAALFAFAWKGTGSEKLNSWFSSNAARVKLLSALFFLLMAALIIFL